jgi:hypothetical protein
MEEKIYVVTLHRQEDLEQFYYDMNHNNFKIALKRPLSRNTHYWLTEEDAKQLCEDSRVWGVELQDDFQIRPQTIVNNNLYNKSGIFWKDDTVGPATVAATDLQWGHLHCSGNQLQRRKGSFGRTQQETVSDSISVYNDGKHVDVVIVDDPVSYDCVEFNSPSTGSSRFVQYQWFNQLNSYISSIDDDGQSVPTGTISYHTNGSNPYFHGVHVTGTACGQYYGWARESNIYNLAVTGVWQSGQSVGALLIFDYLRAFHRYKAVNPTTGKKNPTITNHSYGGIVYMPNNDFRISGVSSVYYRGNTYNSSSPGPSGWTELGLTTDFGLVWGVDVYPAWSAAISADIQDAIDDGIVIIGAAGNDNLMIASPDDQDWNNYVFTTTSQIIHYNRGAWPNTPDSGSITVGALSNYSNFRRSTYTQYGPGVDIFAPGDAIISAYNNSGLSDSKYGGSPNYYYPLSGTSMASPQVCGAVVISASGKDRYTQSDAKKYLNDTSISNDMTFNTAGGGFTDATCQKGSPNLYLHVENLRKTSGVIEEVRGERKSSGQIFPRRSLYYSQ